MSMDPPWALQIIRLSGAPARIALNQVWGGALWRWQLGSQPRLSSSDRPTPENALQSWIDRHIEALHVDSQQAIRNLQGQWQTQGLPHPQAPPQEEDSQRGREEARPEEGEPQPGSPAGPDLLLLLPKLTWPAEVGANGRRREKNGSSRQMGGSHEGSAGTASHPTSRS